MNKNGWGLRVELLYILMFLFCLVIATIGLNRLGLLGENPDALIKPDTEEKEVYSYEPLERKLASGMLKFYRENARPEDYLEIEGYDFATMDIDAYVNDLFNHSFLASEQSMKNAELKTRAL